jgi:mitogen-activated protein kinase kinase
MQPPTEAEVKDQEASRPPENAAGRSSSYMTEDKEVAEWVHKQLELRASGQLKVSEKPALHAVALDKVATSPILEDPNTPAQTD